MPRTDQPASAPFRAAVGTVGAGFLLAGGWSVATSLQALVGLVRAVDGSVYGIREVLFLAAWAIFSFSLVIAGLALLRAAWRGRRRNLVPGPTLYVAGACLVVMALFMLAAGALVPSALTALLGGILIVAEYRSDVI